MNSLRFTVLLLALLATVFGLHLAILHLLENPLFAHQIVLSYAVNFALAAGIYFIIQKTFSKSASYAGFIFMGGSAFKFLIFFLVFYPVYNADDAMETAEFITFFVPYAVCLVLEVIYLSKQLNNQSSEVPISEEKKQ